MARKKSKFTESAEDLNLVPIMNLVLVLIPAVLFQTQLVKIGMVNVSAPKIGPSKPQKDQETPDTKPLGLTVALSKDKGFLLKATGGDLFDLLGVTKVGDEPSVQIPLTTDKYLKQSESGTDEEVDIKTYDYPTLYNHLSKLKDVYKDEKLLTLTADPDLEFKHLIRTMDVVRYRFKKSLPLKNMKDISGAEQMGEAGYEVDVATKTNDKGESVEVKSKVILWDQVTFAIAQ
jgi:biopolymer transport protein ExbD